MIKFRAQIFPKRCSQLSTLRFLNKFPQALAQNCSLSMVNHLILNAYLFNYSEFQLLCEIHLTKNEVELSSFIDPYFGIRTWCIFYDVIFSGTYFPRWHFFS